MNVYEQRQVSRAQDTRLQILTSLQRRWAQNRAAQRAYRQRKDHSLKQKEHEIESLREELDKAQRLNKSLCEMVSVLRERLKEAPEDQFVDGC